MIPRSLEVGIMMSEPYSVVFIDYGILKGTHLGREEGEGVQRIEVYNGEKMQGDSLT